MKRPVLPGGFPVPGLALACFLLSLVLGMTPAGFLLGLAAAGLAWSRRDRRRAGVPGSWKFWIIPAIFILIVPFLAFEPDRELFGLGYSLSRLRQGAGFLFRAFLFFLVAGGLLSGLRLESVVSVSRRLRLPQAGLRLALALAIMNSARREVSETWRIFRAQSPGIAAGAREIHVFWGALLRNAARQSEETARLLYLRNIRINPAGKTAASFECHTASEPRREALP